MIGRRKVTLPIFFLTNFLVGVTMPSSVGSGRSTLQGELGDRFLSWFCVCGPFAARGAHGEEEYP
jgi:hypothetical protein